MKSQMTGDSEELAGRPLVLRKQLFLWSDLGHEKALALSLCS
jgi:hypothetical protein